MAHADEPVDPDVDLRFPAQRIELDAPFLAAISCGGVLGALARYGIDEQWPARSGFPWATLCINVAGCLLIAVLMVALTEVLRAPHRLARPFLGVGVLGGFTTFSTWAVDTVRLVDSDQVTTAIAYVVATPVLAVGAVVLGARFTRHLAGVAS